MKYFLIGIILLASFSCKKNSSESIQNPIEIDSAYIEKKLTRFTLENNKIVGSGGETIKKIIGESQFIVFGEGHYSKQTSLLTKALIPMLHKEKFTDFVAEIGSNTAEKMIALSTPYQETVANLRTFTTKYKYNELGETADPIPFFAGVEDAEFFQEIRKHDINFHGIDQEYYYSILFFTDELLAEAKNKSNFEEIKNLKEKIDKKIYQYLKDEQDKKIKSAIEAFVKDDEINAFFNQFSKNDTKATKIINDLKLSWDIYTRWRTGSHFDRISYMRNNLLQIHNQQQNSKIFVKIGSVHASKILSKGCYDIGFLTEELAKENGTISTSINSWRPFYKENEVVTNNLKKYKRYFNKFQLFTQFAKENQWIIIDLRSIREDIKAKKVKLPTGRNFHHFKSLIDGYDYQFILPVDAEITYNIKK